MTRRELNKKLSELLGEKVFTKDIVAVNKWGESVADFVALYGDFETKSNIPEDENRTFYWENESFFYKGKDEVENIVKKLRAEGLLVHNCLGKKLEILVEVSTYWIQGDDKSRRFEFLKETRIDPSLVGRHRSEFHPFIMKNRD